MKNNIYLLILLVSSFGFSQVKDISFTFSPVGNYTFWDDKAGLEDGFLYGGKLGFGFGEYLELRAEYMKSNNLKTNFENYNFTGFDAALFTPQEIELTRWGGEFKANFSTSRLSPYVTLGTGVQNLAIKDGADYDQIYTSLGLGIKTKISDRIILNIEGKNTAYNFNSGKYLLTDDDKTAFGVTDADFESNLLYNWSVQASLQFYLGGRKPGTLSALDRAYLNKFHGGVKGMQWIFEPGGSYVAFSDHSQFRDSYFLGGYAGIDFNRFTGVRAFYFHATENNQLSTKFDKLAMYGLEFRARLNDGNGVTPYLVLGGGFLNPENNYETKDLSVMEDGQKFASAGLGLNIPLSKNILIIGGVRGLITSSQEIEDLTGPEALQTHIMYNAGIKLTFGKNSKNPDDIYNSQLDDALNEQDAIAQAAFSERLALQKANNEEKLANLKEQYILQLDSLQVELENANATNDVKKAVEILEKKKETTKALAEVETVTKKSVAQKIQVVQPVPVPSMENKLDKEIEIQKTTTNNSPKELIKMTPQELETLIDKILEKTDPNPAINKTAPSNSSEVQQLNKRIDFLEKLILERNGSSAIEKKTEISTNPNDKAIEELKLKAELNAKKIDLANSKSPRIEKTVIINTDGSVTTTTKTIELQADGTTTENVSVEKTVDGVKVDENAVVTKEGRFIKNETTSGLSEKLDYTGASAYVGMNFGEQSTPNVGLRFNYGFKNSSFEFMPELYYGIATPSAFGLSGNFIYKFKEFSEGLTPYAGIGGGFSKIDGNTGLHHNILVGTNLKFLGGRLFADFTSRNFSKNNQIALGYRFNF